MLSCALLLLSVAQAQTKPADPAPDVKHVSIATENKILKAEHDFDQADILKQQLNNQYQQIVKAYQEADKKSKDAQVAIEAATEEAWKESKLSKDEYTFDPANFTFVSKAPKK